MTPERLHKVEELYYAARERDVTLRAAYLHEACAGDEGLRGEVESLLAQEAEAGSFLEASPRKDVAARAAPAAISPGQEPAPGPKASQNAEQAASQEESLVGRQLGSYLVRSKIGEGGMGEVYRAFDTKLRRDVALKVLPKPFARDLERLARFRREAQLLASLNHKNIAAIYGFEELPEANFLVLELIEGETFAERIQRQGKLPISQVIKEALTLAGQVAEGLEAAHRKGITHRDIKPANIKVTPEGEVKVLDFGLAKAFAGDRANADLSELPTLEPGPTKDGQILGTPAYMSPEQVRGQEVDKRTDIWAFGCVLYELLTSQGAFRAATVSDTVAGVLEREPDWTVLLPSTPSTIRTLLRRCLQKDANRRLHDIADARIEIEEALTAPTSLTPSEPAMTAVPGSAPKWRRANPWYVVAATGVMAALLAAFAVWNLRTAPAPPAKSVARFLLPIPSGVRLDMTNFDSSIALSPDSTHLAFVASRGATRQIYLRTIEDAETKALPGTEGATKAFFSPDGQWLAFFAGGKLKKLPMNGGPPMVLSDAPSSRGGFWGENGTIVFSPQARGDGIFQVSADGGAPKRITTLDTSKGETSHRLPELLPDGRVVLFTVYGSAYQDVSIVAQLLETGERRVLIEGASLPHYASTGHLLYVQPKLPGVVMAVAFDPQTFTITGTPAPVLDGVLTDRGDYAHWAVSHSGMLVYAPGGFQEEENNLVWVDRNGIAVPTGAPPRRPYHFPRLSPDGRRVVVSLHGIQNTLWTYDPAGNAFNRLTFEGNNDWPVWTPDGRRVTYASNRAEPWRLFWKPADGSGKEEMLLTSGGSDQQPYSWSPDGKVLVYQGTTAQDIWILPMDGERQPRPFLQTPASEVDASFSPDGRWLAYASNESGRYEIYVQPFPSSGGKWQISTEGGREPLWARNGHELFYRSGEKMMVADVTARATFTTTTPRLLFQGPYLRTPTISPEYDVTADGQRFLMVQPSEQHPPATEFNVVLNWFEELKRRVPAQQ